MFIVKTAKKCTVWAPLYKTTHSDFKKCSCTCKNALSVQFIFMNFWDPIILTSYTENHLKKVLLCKNHCNKKYHTQYHKDESTRIVRHVIYEGQNKSETKKLKRNHFRNLHKDLSIAVTLILHQQYEGEDCTNWLRARPL